MAPKKTTAPPAAGLYPELPQNVSEDQKVEQSDTSEAKQFRLHKISEIRHFLENEVNQRDKLRRKYKSAWNVFYNMSQVSGVLAIGSGAGAVGTLATGVGAAISIPLSSAAIVGGLLSGSCVAFGKATMKKVEKHESIKRTAESSLNTVNDLVSRALEDGEISNEDFHHILREMENYRSHKAGIKSRTRSDLIEMTAEREREIRAEAEKVGEERVKKQAVAALPFLEPILNPAEKKN